MASRQRRGTVSHVPRSQRNTPLVDQGAVVVHRHPLRGCSRVVERLEERPARHHLAPATDIRNGAHMKIDEVTPSNVYTFAYYIFQQLNSWPKSGAEDYGANIWRLSAFFTDAFQQALLRDLDERGHRGELAYRKRALFESPGTAYEDWRVQVLSDGSWVVLLDLEIEETVRGVTVKKPKLRYPLKVFRSRADPERNPYGLVLAGFAGEGPRRVESGVPEDGKGHG